MDVRRASPARARVVRGLALVGAGAVLLGVGGIWWAAIAHGGGVYVSELGAATLPDALLFNSALLAVAIGGLLVGLAVRGYRPTVRILGAWSVSTSLIIAGVAFALASRVPCTAGCPVPFVEPSSPQDAAHIGSAIVGFAAAVWAMVQTGWSPVPLGMRRTSRAGALLVGATALTGALLSVAGAGSRIGGVFEFVAMTIAVVWLAVLGIWRAARPRPQRSPRR